MVEFKGALAFGVVVAIVAKVIEGAYDNLIWQLVLCSLCLIHGVRRTCWLPPGSFTVVNWSSLYFLNAGSNDRVGSSPVIVFIARRRFSQNQLRKWPHRAITRRNIRELLPLLDTS